MKTIPITMGLVLAFLISFAENDRKKNYTASFVNGSPSIQSINSLEFGPQGILFLGDSKSASVFAIDTKDETVAEGSSEIKVEGVDEKIASVLGANAEEIKIQDIAVNPISKKVYVAVQNADGNFALLRLQGTKFETVALDNVGYSSVNINNAIAADATDRRGRSQRVYAISDMEYQDDKLMLTGLSNQEFGSTFRSIPFPFTDSQEQASLEIYHAAHGKYETHSPIKTFTTAMINGKKHVIASYTCTPLVIFPVDDLKSGKHVKGRTVAELGNRNTPLDVITMEKNGKSYLLMANSSRALMKIGLDQIEQFSGSLSERPKKTTGTAGVDFYAMNYVNVQQLEKLDDSRFIVLQRKSNGSLDLFTGSDRWL
ncbi:MAG: hypothetical protein JXQ96_00960 [Cyclobacteriaceae bacterium]